MPEFLQTGLDFARDGFAGVNAVQGLVVALVAALMLSNWSRLIFVAAAAVAAHVALDVLSPVFAEVVDFRLPQVLDFVFWRYLALLYVGYLIAIGILFAIKRVVVKG